MSRNATEVWADAASGLHDHLMRTSALYRELDRLGETGAMMLVQTLELEQREHDAAQEEVVLEGR